VNLEAHACNLPHLSLVFITYSCADHQWDDLQRHMPGYDTWMNGTDQERRKLAWENIQNNPQIVAAWLHLRFDAFYKHVLLPYLKVHDYWYQYEWQARSTGHIHAIIWIDDAPKMGGMKKEEV
jgi:hypothetical protein